MMISSANDPYDEFRLVDQYDSLEDPWSQSEFLDANGTTRSRIEALRARRDAAREADRASVGPCPGSPRPTEPQRRGRSPRRPRVVATRPPNRTDARYTTRRRASRTVVLVVVIRLG
ncbi:hypothetical protein [Streptomyces sp. NPDC047973]|uniref:hypothetical protein n=1 Tax=Streptomyces sp. NPDC047973 TaxID=3155383 RepID=UPI0034143EDB